MIKRADPESVVTARRAAELHRQGHLAEAAELFERVVATEPRHFYALNMLGMIAAQKGEPARAVALIRKAIATDPLHAGIADAYLNLGSALQECGDFGGAVACFDRVLGSRPDDARAHSNKGAALAMRGHLEAALESIDRAIALRPDDARAHANRGSLLMELLRPADARMSFDRAIALSPDFADAYRNRALAALLLGDFAAGWRDYEWRLRVPRFGYREFPVPQWNGDADLAGKTVLLHAEQGLGDTLQFVRYASRVADLGATVVLEAEPSLVGLLRSVAKVGAVIPRGETLPRFDYHCPLLSLPRAFGTTLESIPANVPYLTADPVKVDFWRSRLAGERRLKIGLVWAGGHRADRPDLWSVNSRRNVPLATLAPLALSGCVYYSLQKGDAATAELAALDGAGWDGPPIVDETTALEDFSDTAALVTNLDLVIAVDTSIVHLAGALGRPVWLLNRYDTCWRWLLDRNDSPWYPTLRVYRQARRGDWAGVVNRVRDQLERWFRDP